MLKFMEEKQTAKMSPLKKYYYYFLIKKNSRLYKKH